MMPKKLLPLSDLISPLHRRGLGRESDINMNPIPGPAHSERHANRSSLTEQKWMLSLALSLLVGVVWAHGDEDHSGGKPVVASTLGFPSAEARSDDFELLAQLKGKTLQVYLDRYSDNAPVENAQIEVESGAFKTQLKAITPGQYEAQAITLSAVGEHALVFSIVAGEQSDLLEATLKVSDAPVAKVEHAAASGTLWRWVGAAAAVLAALSLLWSRQRRSSRKPSGRPA